MIHNLKELGRAGHVLNEALALLESDLERLEQQHGPVPNGDGTAGSALQTLYGTTLLTAYAREQLKWVALVAGFASLGMGERADYAMKMACLNPMDIPSAANRMARPLSGATVRALDIIRDLDDFFGWDIRLLIDEVLAASHSTFLPLRD
ncbi:hypothetical protein ACIBAH_34060 [Streptomyces sp. NPDC051445]|uniref:hypothetical protein n=1 Tax=Streptomyces sp. NPDC051445 TaxID=3365653 RepID=UPI0037996B90